MVNGILLKRWRIVIFVDLTVKQKILDSVHYSPTGGHSGYEKTLRRS